MSAVAQIAKMKKRRQPDWAGGAERSQTVLQRFGR